MRLPRIGPTGRRTSKAVQPMADVVFILLALVFFSALALVAKRLDR